MKNKLINLALAALAVVLLGSCSKINERIDKLEKRVDGIENEKIASIDSQIASINSSIADLGTIRSNVSSLRSQVDDHSTDIFNLEEADRALKDRILNLEDYLDDVLPTYAEKDWVKATFSTLEQYEATCDTIAKIDARIGRLDERLSKEIRACADSMKSWVNVQFEAYYTAAEMDAALEYMQAEIDSAKVSGKVTDERVDSLANELTKTKAAVDSAKAQLTREYKAAIDTAITHLEGNLDKKLQKQIEKVNSDITALAVRVTNLEISVATLTNKVIALEKMIQTVTIVPAYSDGSVKVEKDTLYLDCIVSPVSAVSSLTKANFTVLVNKVLTKAVDIKAIGITKDAWFSKNPLNGTVSLKVPVEDNIPESADSSLTAAVNVQNGISNYTTEFVPVYVVPVEPYVIIEAKYDGENVTPLKWYRQNLAISASGKKAWKGGNTSSAVKVPGTNDDVIVGDYFQWGASYKGYNLTAENQKPENLLIYTAFTNTGCGDSENKFTFRSAGEGKTYRFNTSSMGDYVGISPYHDGSNYTKYNSDSKTVLERTPEVNDDVANIILGGDWHIPTADEFTAMQEATYWAWDVMDKGYYVFKPGQGTAGVAGQHGDIAEADNKADALLFLPAAGFPYDTYFSDLFGTYWSSTLSDSDLEEFDYVYYLCFENNSSYLEPQDDYMYREHGLSIRPVSE